MHDSRGNLKSGPRFAASTRCVACMHADPVRAWTDRTARIPSPIPSPSSYCMRRHRLGSGQLSNRFSSRCKCVADSVPNPLCRSFPAHGSQVRRRCGVESDGRRIAGQRAVCGAFCAAPLRIPLARGGPCRRRNPACIAGRVRAFEGDSRVGWQPGNMVLRPDGHGFKEGIRRADKNRSLSGEAWQIEWKGVCCLQAVGTTCKRPFSGGDVQRCRIPFGRERGPIRGVGKS